MENQYLHVYNNGSVLVHSEHVTHPELKKIILLHEACSVVIIKSDPPEGHTAQVLYEIINDTPNFVQVINTQGNRLYEGKLVNALAWIADKVSEAGLKNKIRVIPCNKLFEDACIKMIQDMQGVPTTLLTPSEEDAPIEQDRYEKASIALSLILGKDISVTDIEFISTTLKRMKL